MTQIDQAKTILHKVLSDYQSTQDVNLSCQRGKNRHYLVIPGKKAPRWIVPENSRYARSVLDQWQPYGNTSRFKWKVVRLFYRYKIARLIPGIHRVTGAFRRIVPQMKTQLETVPVIYVGTPGNQQKAVVTLVDDSSLTSLSVMKVALAEGAVDSLSREAEMLARLVDAGVTGVPVLIDMDASRHRTWQTVLVGTPTNRQLTWHHVDWLLQLPRSRKTTTLDNQAQNLRNLLDGSGALFQPEQMKLLEHAIDRVSGQYEIPIVLVHGDFAPWNIKQDNNHRLLVMDWEDARFDGLPLWDLSHYHLMQAHLFNETGPIIAMQTEQMINKYLEGIGVRQSEMQALILLYCLYQLINEAGVSEAYRAFLLCQVQGLLDI